MENLKYGISGNGKAADEETLDVTLILKTGDIARLRSHFGDGKTPRETRVILQFDGTPYIEGRARSISGRRPIAGMFSIGLTEREVTYMDCVVIGMKNNAIASENHCSTATVKRVLGAIYEKLGARNRAEAAVLYERMYRR